MERLAGWQDVKQQANVIVGHSCISTTSYNPRAFLYLYCFVQLRGILEWLPILTTKVFHIFVFMLLLSDNTLSSI